MNAIIKKVVAVMAAVVMAVTAAVSVSADYATVNNFGLFYEVGSNTLTQVNVGDKIPNNNQWSVRWALTGLNPDYTYDIFFDCGFSSAVDCSGNTFSPQSVYYSTQQEYLQGYLFNNPSKYNWNILSNFNGSIEQLSDNRIRFHIYYNYNLSGLKLSQLQLAFAFKCYNWPGTMINLTYMSQGVGAYYDPGGDTYSQLIYEYGQDNPLPDVKDIKDQGNAMSSAEAAVRDKSVDLVASVESDWSAMQSTAKAGVTSLQTAAATVNSAFGLVMDELPDEVKILFVAIPILLFIGWLIGRVRE